MNLSNRNIQIIKLYNIKSKATKIYNIDKPELIKTHLKETIIVYKRDMKESKRQNFFYAKIATKTNEIINPGAIDCKLAPLAWTTPVALDEESGELWTATPVAFVVLGLAEPFPLDPAACDCCCGLPGACDCDLPGAGVVADTSSNDVVTVTTGATPGLDSTTTADDVLLGFPLPIELMSVQLQSSIVTVREEVSTTVAQYFG
jgi:hypothetical protein